jgi:hypothetical protein
MKVDTDHHLDYSLIRSFLTKINVKLKFAHAIKDGRYEKIPWNNLPWQKNLNFSVKKKFKLFEKKKK